MTRHISSLAAACGLVLVAAGAALAQDPPPPPAPMAPDPMGPGHGAKMREHLEHMRGERLRVMHDALSIRPDQEGAWKTFAESMARPRGQHDWGPAGAGHGQGAAERRPLTTPERLDRMIERAQAHVAALQTHAAAAKAFYAVLSPTQQRTFDALAEMRRKSGGMGHGGMRQGGMGRPGMMGHDGMASSATHDGAAGD